MKKEDCFYLGKVVKTHGLKGEVTLKIDADDPSAYLEMKHFFLEINKVLTPFFVEKITMSGDKFFIAVQDVKTIEAAQHLVGKQAYLPLEMLPKLSGKQFYFHEIVGFTVVDTEKGELGPEYHPAEHLLAVGFRQMQFTANGYQLLITVGIRTDGS